MSPSPSHPFGDSHIPKMPHPVPQTVQLPSNMLMLSSLNHQNPMMSTLPGSPVSVEGSQLSTLSTEKIETVCPPRRFKNQASPPPQHIAEKKNTLPAVKPARKFHCPYAGCKKVFRRQYEMRTHSRVHTDERPYQCSRCHAQFKWRSGHRYHRLHNVCRITYPKAEASSKVTEQAIRSTKPHNIAQERTDSRFKVLPSGKREIEIGGNPGETFYNAHILTKTYAKQPAGIEETWSLTFPKELTEKKNHTVSDVQFPEQEQSRGTTPQQMNNQVNSSDISFSQYSISDKEHQTLEARADVAVDNCAIWDFGVLAIMERDPLQN